VHLQSLSTPNVFFIRQLIFHLKTIRYMLQLSAAPDVVLFHQVSALWLLPLRIVRHVRRRPRPLFVMDTRTVHMPPKEKEGMRGHLRRIFLVFVHQVANLLADGQTTITQRMAQVVHVPTSQLWGTWPSGVVVEEFSPAQRSRTWPDIGDPVHLIYIGTLHYERNLMTLCKAVELANKRGMTFTLTLLGEGSERDDLEMFAQQTSGNIRVLPPISHEQVPKLLAQAHVGVLPFPDEEKFRVSSPIKLFEYMAAGLPILATRIVCHTDVIGDGDYVFWAESADVAGIYAALRNLWNQRERLPQQSKLAAAAAPAWSWHAAAQKLSTALLHGLAIDKRDIRISRLKELVKDA
jgi:glycosyltransferase involved in cell wall biosynthesis